MASLLNKSDVLSNNSQRLVSDVDYAAVELFEGYPDGLLRVAYGCCIAATVIGIPGNVITIAALAGYKRVHNATAIFIINLSCADLLFCCIGPPLTASVYRRRAWPHGRLLCRLYPLVTYTLIAVSIFTVLAITINRYIIVIYPRIYRRIYQKRNLMIMLVAIWISPLLSLIPTFLGKWGTFDLDPINGSCSLIPDQNKRSPKQFLLIAIFGFPCIPIFFCYARIYFVVRKTTQKCQTSNQNKNSPSSNNRDTTTGDYSSTTVRFTHQCTDVNEENGKGITSKHILNARSEHSTSTAITIQTPDEEVTTDLNTDEDTRDVPRFRRNVLKTSMAFVKKSLPTRKDKRLRTMICAIMTSFCVCHIPMVLTKVSLYLVNPQPVHKIAAYLVFYCSSCINPLIYVVMSSEYQKAYINLFKCIFRRKVQNK